MASVYCCFDWEDDTTTVNSISVIQEPRKPWNEYEVGEKTVAKLPKYGRWEGVIIEISESKEELLRHMNERQAFPVYNDFRKASDCDDGSTSRATLSGSVFGRKKAGNAKVDKVVNSGTNDDGPEYEGDSSRPKKKVKTTEKKKTDEKMVDTENQRKSKEEKQKRKVLEKVRLETKTKEYEDIIAERRQTTGSSLNPNTSEEGITSEKSRSAGEAATEQVGTAEQQDQGLQIDPYGSELNPCNTQPNRMLFGNSSWHEYEQRTTQNYSYVEDLRQTDMQFGTSFQSLLSYQELLEQNRDLEAENYNLREEVKELKEQLESRSPKQSLLPGLEVTPRKIEFFKGLTQILEVSKKSNRLSTSSRQLFQHSTATPSFNTQQQSTPACSTPQPQSTPTSVYSLLVPQPQSAPAPCTPHLLSTVTVAHSPCTPQQQSTTAHSPHTQQPQSTVNEATTYTWEDNVTSTGQKKIQLASNIACFITQQQVSHALHVGNQPRKLVIALLDILFSREQLARSSSTGARSAVNVAGALKTVGLPSSAVRAIKTFVLNQFKKDSGEPCLIDAMFNNVINSKCATARRSLK